MMSWHWHIFLINGPLWWESTNHLWFSLTKTSYAELLCFAWCKKKLLKKTTELLLVIWDTMTLMWCHSNVFTIDIWQTAHMRVNCGVSFVSSKFDLYSTLVVVMLSVISCYVWLCYNGRWLCSLCYINYWTTNISWLNSNAGSCTLSIALDGSHTSREPCIFYQNDWWFYIHTYIV